MGDQSQTRKLDVASYWCNDFSQGCSGDETLKYSDDMAQGFARTMKRKGHRWTIDHGSAKASPADFVDITPQGATTPLDNDDRQGGVDTADFAYLVSHGGINFIDLPDPQEDIYLYRVGFGQNAPSLPATAFQLPRRNNNQFSSTCLWLSHKSRLGDKRLQWLIVDACESAQLPGFFKPMGQSLEINPAKTWGRSFDGLNMLLGFHGDSTDSWWGSDRGGDFAGRIARGDRIADAWLDEGFSRWTGDRPVALACGRTAKDSLERLHKDSLGAPYPKLPHADIGAFSWLWWS